MDWVGSSLGSSDTRTKLVDWEKFEPKSDPIDGRIGSIQVKFGRVGGQVG